ncbi:MAG: hypothetical protein MUO67_18250 [Anaerolineales bacterium]|nr:hypothetical protein [Anaerolineales bacterium]
MNNNQMKIRESSFFGVKARIPSNFEIECEPVDWVPAMGQTEFRVHRLVVNYTLSPVDPEKDGFSPAKLLVFYTQADDNLKPDLDLAKWKGEDWIRLGANKVPLERHLWAGYFEIEITDPNDPSIALGE